MGIFSRARQREKATSPLFFRSSKISKILDFLAENGAKVAAFAGRADSSCFLLPS